MGTVGLVPRITIASAGRMLPSDTKTPLPFHTLFRQIYQSVGYFGKLMNIPPIIVGKSKEGPDVLYVLGSTPFSHSFDLHFSGTHASWRHLLPKELNALVVDLALQCLRK